MTTASELFYNRRSRVARSTPDLGFDSTPDRNFHHNFNRRHCHSNNSHRNNLDDCDPLRRSPHVRHLGSRGSHSERLSVRFDQGPSQSNSSNSINAETLISTSTPRFTGNNQLPGAVLLARERLVERLRGVSLSGNRRGSRASSGIYHHDRVFGNVLRHVDAGDWETSILGVWSAGTGSSLLPDVTSQSERSQLLQETNKKKPPGLTQEALDCLHLEIFTSTEKGVEVLESRSSRECSICLENFMEGDELISLTCSHRFHSLCLDPWVRTCGDCPYCRRCIVVSYK